MAIDSALKRFSATGLLLPFRGGCFPGTAGIVVAERQAVTWLYSGIAAIVVVAVYANIRETFTVLPRTTEFTVKPRITEFTVLPRITEFTVKE